MMTLITWLTLIFTFELVGVSDVALKETDVIGAILFLQFCF